MGTLTSLQYSEMRVNLSLGLQFAKRTSGRMLSVIYGKTLRAILPLLRFVLKLLHLKLRWNCYQKLNIIVLLSDKETIVK